MKKTKWIWNILGATLGIGTIACIISVRVASCGSSSNSSFNSTNNSTPSASSTSTLSGNDQNMLLTNWTNQFDMIKNNSNCKQTIVII